MSPCSDATVLKDWQTLFQSSFSQPGTAFKHADTLAVQSPKSLQNQPDATLLKELQTLFHTSIAHSHPAFK